MSLIAFFTQLPIKKIPELIAEIQNCGFPFDTEKGYPCLHAIFPSEHYFDEGRPTEKFTKELYQSIKEKSLGYEKRLFAALCLLLLAPTIWHQMIMLNDLEVDDLKELIALRERVLTANPKKNLEPFASIFILEDALAEKSWNQFIAFPTDLLSSITQKYPYFKDSFLSELPFLIHLMILRIGLLRGELGRGGGTEDYAGFAALSRATRFCAVIDNSLDEQGNEIYTKWGIDKIVGNLRRNPDDLNNCIKYNGKDIEKIILNSESWSDLKKVHLFTSSQTQANTTIVEINKKPKDLTDGIKIFKEQAKIEDVEFISHFLQLIKEQEHLKNLVFTLQETLYPDRIIDKPSHMNAFYQEIKNEGF
jgi:hypothetical protein